MSLPMITAAMESSAEFHLGSYFVKTDHFSGGLYIAYLYPRCVDNDILLAKCENIHEEYGECHNLLNLAGFPVAVSALNVFDAMLELNNKLSFKSHQEVDLWAGRVQDIWWAIVHNEEPNLKQPLEHLYV